MPRQQITLRFSTADDTVYDFAASPHFASDGICFAACGSGLYRSADGGRHWESLSLSDGEKWWMAATAVALSPTFAHDRTVLSAVKGGIRRSSDGGDTWFTTVFPAPPPLFTALEFSPDFARDGMALASTMEDGLFSSTDRGLSWQAWNFGLFDLRVLCLTASPKWREDETVYAGTETGLYRSGNGGRAWRETSFPEECAPVLSIAAHVDSRGDTVLFAGTETQGLFASCDQGATWDSIATEAPRGSVNHLQAEAPLPHALVDDEVLRSQDQGQSWRVILRANATPTAMLATDETLLLGIHGQGIVRYTTA